MDTLNLIWQYVLPIGGGVTVGAVLIAIATILFKGFANKLIAKVNIGKVEDKAVEKGVEKIKEISFKQSIEPLAKSELEKITEQANEYIKDSLEQAHKDNQKMLLILKKFASFFDNSIAITEEKKQELKELIDEALEDKINAQDIVIEELVKEEPIVENKKSKKVER